MGENKAETVGLGLTEPGKSWTGAKKLTPDLPDAERGFAV